MRNFYPALFIFFVCVLFGLSPSIAQTPNFEWAVKAQGTNSSPGSNGGRAIACDGQNNIYVIGYYRNKITFVSANGLITLNGSNALDMFIAKYDASGNALWARTAGSTTYIFGADIAVDGSGNSYITGNFQGNITFGGTTLTNGGDKDVFVTKFDALGNFIWVKKAGGTGDDYGESIAVDGSGNSYVTGSFSSSSFVVGSTSLANSGNTDMFLAKFNTSGTVLWAQKSVGGSDEYGSSIAVDGNGNSYVTGAYRGNASFGSFSLTPYNSAAEEIFIAKYDPSGNVMWAKQAGGIGEDVSSGIAVDISGNFYLTFAFRNGATIGAFTFTNAGFGRDLVVAKGDASGNVIWAKKGGNYSSGNLNSDSYCSDIKVDGNGNCFVTGGFTASLTLGNITLTSSGGNDFYIAKYDNSGNVVWAKNAVGTGNDRGTGLTLDSNGNCYATGNFLSTIISFGSNFLNGSGNSDPLIAKYDASGTELWAVNPAGAIASDNGRDVAVDNQGNSYVTGSFQGKIVIGSSTLNSNGSNDIFIAKYDASGNALWAKSAGGTYYEDANSLAIDVDGNSYVTGSFNGSVSFGSTTLVATGSTDMFIAKYDASGNILWAKKAGGSDYIYDVVQGFGNAVDVNGNSYVTGSFTGSATFGSTTLLSSVGISNIFIAKYDASGNVLWAKKAGGSNYGIDNAYGTGIALDASGNSYVTGTFIGSATFGSTTLSPSGSSDIFIAKYDGSGNVLWVKQAGSSSDINSYALAVDGNSNCYLTGYFIGSANFGSKVITSSGSNDIFIAKYDASGNVAWAKNDGGSDVEIGTGITVNSTGNIYLSGYFRGASTLGNTTLTNNGDYDIFVAKYDALGNFVWGKKAGGTNTDKANSITVDSNGNCYLTGYFLSNNIAFGNTTLANLGTEMFLAKITDASFSITTGTVTPNDVCLGGSLNIPFTTSGIYNMGNIFTAQLSDASGSFANPLSIGSTSGSGMIVGAIPMNIPYSNSYRIRVVASNPATIGTDNGSNLFIHPTTDYYLDTDMDGYFSISPTNLCYGPLGRSYQLMPGNDCNDFDNTIYPGATELCDGKDNNCDGTGDPTVSITTLPQTITSGQSLQLTATGATSYSWSSSPAGFTSTSATPTVNPAVTTTYTVTGTGSGCSTTASVTITVTAPPAVSASLSAGQVTGLPGTQVLVPVRVRDFTNMLTVQGTITYNSSMVSLIGMEQFGLPGLSAANFNTGTSGQLTYSWDDATLQGISLADDSAIFALRFNVTGALGTSSPVSFVNTPTPTEFTNTTFSTISVTATNGSITVPANFLTTNNLPVSSVCAGNILHVHYTAGGTFSAGNTFTAQLSDASGSFASPVTIATVSSTTSGLIIGPVPAGTAAGADYRVRVISSAPALIGTASVTSLTVNTRPTAPTTTGAVSCGSPTVTLTASGAPAGGFYQWYTSATGGSPLTGETGATITVPASFPSVNYYVSIVNSSGCESERTSVTGTNVSAPAPPTTTGGSSCGPGAVPLMASAGGPGITYRWYTDASGGSPLFTTSLYVTPVLTTTTTYYVSVVSIEGCESARNPVTATINTAPAAPTASSNSPLAAGSTLNLSASTIAGATYSWAGPNGFTSTQQNPVISNVTSSHAGVYSVTATINGCTSLAGTVTVSVTLSVAGSVRSESNAPINTVSLTANGGGNPLQNFTTASNGTYSFTLGQTGNYTVSAAKSNDVTANNGVTTLDIAMIRRHILGMQALSSPYKLLAADVDASNAVSTADIAQIRSLILTTTTSFGGNQWKFVPSNYVFANPASPFPAPAATLTLNGLAASLTGQDFIGIKLGDVNNTWDNTIARLVVAGNLGLAIPQQTALPGTVVTVPVKVKDFTNVSGYQFTLSWNEQVLAFEGINNVGATGSFGTHQIANGKLTTSWDNTTGSSTTLADGSVIFEVRFRAIGAVGTTSPVSITSDLTKGVAYDQNLDQLNLVPVNGQVRVGSPTGLSEAENNGYVLYQNQPNPFNGSTSIGFSLPKAEEVSLVVYNSLGQVVAKHNGRFAAGEHQLSLEQFQLKSKLSAGAYFYQISAGKFSATKRMIFIGE